MSPKPSEYDDGSARWEVDLFEISAHPDGIHGPAVVLDGRSISPETALTLAAALRDAAIYTKRTRLDL